MVLKAGAPEATLPIARGPAQRQGGNLRVSGNRGVTLVELIMALSLSSLVVAMALALFKDAGFAARLASGRRDAGEQAQAFFSSFSQNLMAGGGVVRLAPGHVELLNLRGRRVDYRWEDSVLSVNGKAMGFRVASLEIEAFGPERPHRADFAPMPIWDLDSLDGNRDGVIDFTEMDRDRDGELEASECRFIARLRVALTVVHKGAAATLTCIVHPRNRVSAAPGDTSAFSEGEDTPP